ncbi:hypothetical protein J421_2675 [Gemmatirosa kalamazoonensis]|uniref:Uncharacterized protein n=1 Tax=Gemmatirosa kalamazoonensis TaxID=861299 RepID=W0RIG7_9BACT|nr:hypothetical protein [Gemmatirosa kalamazoonensis]AHG90212.1 hypothetical protein J421_2675 [Gemmatirosa kalamazoonensis]
MILGTVRRRLGRHDAQLALRLLAQGRSDEHARLERTLADEGLDSLLDDPRLLAELLRAPGGAHASLPLFCYVVVRQALRKLGEDDRALADFAAAIVLHFGLRDRALRVGDVDDQTYTTLADLLADVESGDARRSFLVRAHLGHYALWLSGLFPDHVEARRWRRGGPDLDYYEEMGRRGYQLAASHRLAAEYGMVALFASAAERFGVLRCALTQISDTVLFPHHHTPERLMRQVRDESRYRLAG